MSNYSDKPNNSNQSPISKILQANSAYQQSMLKALKAMTEAIEGMSKIKI